MSDNLTKDERMLIIQQIDDKWNGIDIGYKNIKVKTKIELNIDGSVTKVEITSITCPPEANQICAFVAESIKKIVKEASPIKNLRPDRHDIWKTVELDFHLSSIK